MRWTSILYQSERKLKSLALSVYFKQPEFGMKEYEILSRATAFLLSVDGKEIYDNASSSSYSHLDVAEQKRQERKYKQVHGRTRASGQGKLLMDLNWLEFVPREVRPQVHIVCSSHVLSPFLWKDYYPQDWLSKVRQEHCIYSLEVYDNNNTDNNNNNNETKLEPLAKFAINSEPYHHPEGRDIALIHFRDDEKSSLKILKKLGVDMLHLRNPDKLYEKGETMHFDGFVVSERNQVDSPEYNDQQENNKPDNNKNNNNEEDNRVFYPYKDTGKLAFHTEDRFFATTSIPLPEGLCGAPVLDTDNDLCGVVEGIVPTTHKNKNLAGCAAFIPSFVMTQFIDYVERGLVQQMMPTDLFQMIITAKQTNSIGGGIFTKDESTGKYTINTSWENEYDKAIEKMKSLYTKDEMDNIMDVVKNEREQVMKIWEKEGGDLDDIIERVRDKTIQLKAMVMDQYTKYKNEENKEKEEETK